MERVGGERSFSLGRRAREIAPLFQDARGEQMAFDGLGGGRLLERAPSFFDTARFEQTANGGKILSRSEGATGQSKQNPSEAPIHDVVQLTEFAKRMRRCCNVRWLERNPIPAAGRANLDNFGRGFTPLAERAAEWLRKPEPFLQ